MSGLPFISHIRSPSLHATVISLANLGAWFIFEGLIFAATVDADEEETLSEARIEPHSDIATSGVGSTKSDSSVLVESPAL